MSPLDLAPDLRTRLRRLSITPRRPAVVASTGQHASRNRGGSQEFAQYRSYERGDDLRRIDWKLYGRSDRFFVRDSERESPVTVWIVLDASASMGQADLKTPDWSRFNAAQRLAAALVDIALHQGDRFGLVVETATGPMIVPPGGGGRQRDRVLLSLAPITPAGIAKWDRDVEVYGERFGPNDLILILSDAFDEGCVAAAERLAMSGRDVAMIRVLTADERDFPFDQGYRFNDPETGTQLVGDGPALRRDFLVRFAQARRALSDRLGAHGVRYAEHFVDRPADEPIRALFRVEDAR